MSALWVPLINDPEIAHPSGRNCWPADWSTSSVLLLDRHSGGLLAMAAGWSSTGWKPGASAGCCLWPGNCPLVAFHLFAVLPMVAAWGDWRAGLPVREMGAAGPAGSQARLNPLAMVGVLKPSSAYYSRQVGAVMRASRPSGLVNLSGTGWTTKRAEGSGPQLANELADRAGGDRRLHQPAAYGKTLVATPWPGNRILPAPGGVEPLDWIRKPSVCKAAAKPGFSWGSPPRALLRPPSWR